MKILKKFYYIGTAFCFLIIKGFASENTPFTENISANLISSSKLAILGEKLEAAFHVKENIEAIKEFVEQGAPVNYRLDYGLPLKDESDFVASFYILLGGLQGEENILKSARLLLNNEENALALYNYVKTALNIFNILHAQ